MSRLTVVADAVRVVLGLTATRSPYGPVPLPCGRLWLPLHMLGASSERGTVR